MGPPGKLERDACRMAADLPWQISRDLVLKWAEVMVAVRRTGHRIEAAGAGLGAKRVGNTTPAPDPWPRRAKRAPAQRHNKNRCINAQLFERRPPDPGRRPLCRRAPRRPTAQRPHRGALRESSA